jgi:sugar lactone lactonase YvrE
MVSMISTGRAVVLLVVCSLTAVGCQSTKKAAKEPLVFFPPPPAQPRVQYLTWASGGEQLGGQRSGFQSFVLGEEPPQTQVIQKPYGLAAKDGVLYVCDTKGLSLCRLDFKNKTFSVLGTSGPGRLRKPINIAIDQLGYKFVVDPERKQIVVFGPEDAYVTAFDVPAPSHPVDVAVHENELYVLDNDQDPQIVVMDRKSGKVLRSFGASGGEEGQFKVPNSIAVGADGSIYISDTHNWRIQKLSPTGEAIWAKGEPGYVLGKFGRPRGIRVGPDGIVYVVDGATEIVQMFDSDGKVLMRFGGPGQSPGTLGLPSTVAIDATSIPYFQQYVHKQFKVDYLIFVASQYSDRLVNVYAFGAFPPGFRLDESEIQSIEPMPIKEGIGPVEGSETPRDMLSPPHPLPDDETTPEKP